MSHCTAARRGDQNGFVGTGHRHIAYSYDDGAANHSVANDTASTINFAKWHSAGLLRLIPNGPCPGMRTVGDLNCKRVARRGIAVERNR